MTVTRTAVVEALAMTAAMLLVLYLAERILQPVPLGAATAAVGALVARLMDRGRHPVGSVGAGLLLGLLAGAAHHGFIHSSDRSPPPEDGIAAHLLIEGGIGLLVAIVATGAALLTRVAVRKVAR